MRIGKIRKLISVLGILITFSAVAMLMNPALLPEIPEIDPMVRNAAVIGLMLILGLYALKAFRIKPLDSSKLYLTSENLPEAVEDENADLSFGLEASRQDVRKAVKEVLKKQKGKTEEEAEEIIVNGEWTSGSTPSAFIEDSLRYPFLERIRAWLEDSGTNERRLRKTIASIEELHEAES